LCCVSLGLLTRVYHKRKLVITIVSVPYTAEQDFWVLPFERDCLGTTVSALTLWVLGRLGTEDDWLPPFRHHHFGAVSHHFR